MLLLYIIALGIIIATIGTEIMFMLLRHRSKRNNSPRVIRAIVRTDLINDENNE